MEQSKVLEERIEKHKTAIRKLSWKLDEIHNNKTIPALKKKYEGTYWKYNNGYNGNDRWYLYAYCHSVSNVNFFVFDTFQTDVHGEVSIEFKKQSGSHLFQTKITKAEYHRELNKVIRKVNNLKKP